MAELEITSKPEDSGTNLQANEGQKLINATLETPGAISREKALERSLTEALSEYSPLSLIDIDNAKAAYELYNRPVPVQLSRALAAGKDFAQELRPEAILDTLRSPALADQVLNTKLHTPEAEKENGLVLVWFRQAHADSGVGPDGTFISAMSKPAIDNQIATISIGRALGEQGVRFLGLENKAGNLNYSQDDELSLAHRLFKQETVDQYTKELEVAVRDEVSGFEALQMVFPIVDVRGVDHFRGPIISNHAFVENQFLKLSSAVFPLKQAIPND